MPFVSKRRESGIIRVACVGRTEGSEGGWVMELLPLNEDADGLHPVPGEGVRLVLDARLTDRQGDLLDLVRTVTRWTDGIPAAITSERLSRLIPPMQNTGIREPTSSSTPAIPRRPIAGRPGLVGVANSGPKPI